MSSTRKHEHQLFVNPGKEIFLSSIFPSLLIGIMVPSVPSAAVTCRIMYFRTNGLFHCFDDARWL